MTPKEVVAKRLRIRRGGGGERRSTEKGKFTSCFSSVKVCKIMPLFLGGEERRRGSRGIDSGNMLLSWQGLHKQTPLILATWPHGFPAWRPFQGRVRSFDHYVGSLANSHPLVNGITLFQSFSELFMDQI